MKQLLERIEKRLGALEQQFRDRFANHRGTNHRSLNHRGASPTVRDAPVGYDDDVIGVEAAMALTGLSKSGIYHKTCSRNGEPPELAHYKRGKRVYFSRAELIAWMTSTRVKDRTEIEADAAEYMAATYGDAAHGSERASARSSAGSSSRSSSRSSVRRPRRAQDQAPAPLASGPTASATTAPTTETTPGSAQASQSPTNQSSTNASRANRRRSR